MYLIDVHRRIEYSADAVGNLPCLADSFYFFLPFVSYVIAMLWLLRFCVLSQCEVLVPYPFCAVDFMSRPNSTWAWTVSTANVKN
jgi:hypothetical protein